MHFLFLSLSTVNTNLKNNSLKFCWFKMKENAN